MKILLISPKFQFYAGKDVNSQRSYRQIYKKYIDMLREHNVQIICLLEDSLTMGMLEELKYDNVHYVTNISEQDKEFFKKYPEFYDLPEYFYDMYDDAEKMLYNYEKIYTVSPTLMREGKEVYFKARSESARRRISKARESLIDYTSNILQFRASSNMDNIKPLREQISLGDGKLLIEVSLNNGTCVSYYGGTYIPEDLIHDILSL